MRKMIIGVCLRVFILISLLLILSHFVSGTSFGAPEDFPKKEVTIIVNFGPGGGRDTIARGVGNIMSKYLGVPIVVMNTPGAGGALGLTKLYNSAPDGYTLGIGAAADIILQITEKQDYDSKKFTYIGNAQHSSDFLLVKSDSPFRSLKDFKTSGKTIKYSTFSFTAHDTVVSMVIADHEGFPLVFVGGYQGAAAALLGLIRGEVELSGAALSAARPFVRSGQIRPILTIDQKRSPDFPDTPTVGEVGYPELAIFALDFWFMAPPGVPKARVQVLEDALMKTLKDPEFLKWAKGAGVDPGPLGAQETIKLALSLVEFLEKYKTYIEKYLKK
jgi:tripartite-type tricarboxylate transporter receptor subunit TctC